MIAKLDRLVQSIYKGSQSINIRRGRVTNKVTGGKRMQDEKEQRLVVVDYKLLPVGLYSYFT